MNFTCPMHPEVVEPGPGKCPQCGMDLVKNGVTMSSMKHDHSDMMSDPKMAADFLKRFWIVTVLLIPLLLFSSVAVRFLGFPDFATRPLIEFIFATAIFYFGLVFLDHARMEIQMNQYGMMTLVSLGISAGYLFSAISTFIPALNTEFYLEVSTLIWVLLFGHFLEAKSSNAAGDALKEVAKLLPKTAHLKTERGVVEVKVDSLEKNQVVLVKPGEKVPADGKILSGKAAFNEALITGEAKPVSKRPGDLVVAGSIDLDGAIEVELTLVGTSSTVGQIKTLIEKAKMTKPSAQKLADKASKWLTFSAISISVLSLIIWLFIIHQPFVFAITLSITVLVIACPHALGLAIPTVSTIATKLATQNGIFIKDLAKLEVVKKVDYVLFDKTGTLTSGEFGVTNVKVFEGDLKKFLKTVGAIESKSSHLIGEAITSYISSKGITPSKAINIKNLAGEGIMGKVGGKTYYIGSQKLIKKHGEFTSDIKNILKKLDDNGETPVVIASDTKVIGIIGLSDRIKPSSADTIHELHALGVKVALLTGDTKASANAVADKLGIDKVFAQVLPADKYRYVKELQEKGETVLMAGDGVNDAPALTQADVGVALGAGTDIAIEAGDVVLTKSEPERIARLIILSRKVYSKMMQNLFWAAGYNILALPAAAGLFIPLGFRLTPAVGALLMSLSSVIVVANALGLRRAKLYV